jgi:Heavy metal binding domain
MKPLKFLVVIILIMTVTLIFTSCSNAGNNVNPVKSTATLQSQANQSTGDSMYTCTMHDSVMSYHPGKCPVCGMILIKQKMTAKQVKMMKDSTYIKPQE